MEPSVAQNNQAAPQIASGTWYPISMFSHIFGGFSQITKVRSYFAGLGSVVFRLPFGTQSACFSDNLHFTTDLCLGCLDRLFTGALRLALAVVLQGLNVVLGAVGDNTSGVNLAVRVVVVVLDVCGLAHPLPINSRSNSVVSLNAG